MYITIYPLNVNTMTKDNNSAYIYLNPFKPYGNKDIFTVYIIFNEGNLSI